MGQDDDQLIDHRGLTIRVERVDDRVALELKGELDRENAATLDAQLFRAEESDAKRIVVDLSGLKFIDSSGLKSVLRAQRRSNLDSNRLRVVRGTSGVARLLKLTAIDLSLDLLD
jgi:anti-sigma B factor antagonist